MTPLHADDLVTLYLGDCVEVMRELPAESVDAIVTDPPYDLTSGKKGGLGPASVDSAKNFGGFMGQKWDATGVAFDPATWREAFRVAKPGAHLLAFGGTRTWHRLASAIEDAGWEIRDCLVWAYASGFPKSLDVGKAIDKARDDSAAKWAVADFLRPHVERVGFDVVSLHFGFVDETMARARWTSRSQTNTPTWDQWKALKTLLAFGDEMDAEVWRLNGRKGTPGENWNKREVIGERARKGKPPQPMWDEDAGQAWKDTAPATPEAAKWNGWGTALKPAWEPIVMARKPLRGTVAANVLRYSTGALNIAATRIGTTDELSLHGRSATDNGWDPRMSGAQEPGIGNGQHLGRWPANLILTDPIFDGDTPGVVGGGEVVSGAYPGPGYTRAGDSIYGPASTSGAARTLNDSGTYSRFFKLQEGTGCYLCGRARDAEPNTSPARRLAPGALSDAPTSPAGMPESSSDPVIPGLNLGLDSTTDATAPRSSNGGGASTPSTRRSRRPATSPASTPRSSPARSKDAGSPEIGTTTTTADRWTCDTCAALTTSATTRVPADSPDHPWAFLIPKSSRADREPLVRGEIEPTIVNTATPPGSKGANSPRAGAGRLGARENAHPTVKPLDLMRHLVRLVTPPGGTCLDPFLGSGTTAIAANAEGFRCIGIEKEREYLDIAVARMAHQPLGLGLDVAAPTRKRTLPSDEKLAELAKTYRRADAGYRGGWGDDEPR